jgi:hypothetical protein
MVNVPASERGQFYIELRRRSGARYQKSGESTSWVRKGYARWLRAVRAKLLNMVAVFAAGASNYIPPVRVGGLFLGFCPIRCSVNRAAFIATFLGAFDAAGRAKREEAHRCSKRLSR